MSGDALGALAARAVDGDGKALAELCRRLEAPVYRLCLRMLGDVRDAEDAAQDVLVKVVTHLARFQGRSALMTWVHTVAVRHVLGLKKSRAEERALDEDAFAALLEQGLAFGATQPPPTPEDRTLITEVRLSCTQGMLLTLSRDERLALCSSTCSDSTLQRRPRSPRCPTKRCGSESRGPVRGWAPSCKPSAASQIPTLPAAAKDSCRERKRWG